MSTAFGAFGVREFRVLWTANLASLVGDQLARVALSVLVFERTGSAAATAATYALTMLPALVSGFLLSWVADRFPRRTVMVVCDLLRAALLGLMAVPGVPLPWVAALLVAAQFAEAPFSSAQGAVLPDMLGVRYEAGQAIQLITQQTCLVLGFATGGLVVTAVGTSGALAVDAVTFAASAVLLRWGVAAYPVSQATAPSTGALAARWWVQVRVGAVLVFADRRLRTLMWLGWLATFTVVPEGLAAPFAAQSGAGVGSVGLVLAAEPVGAVAGAVLLRFVPRVWRIRLLGVLAVGTSLPLLGYAGTPSLPWALPLLAVSGVFSAYQVTAGATFVQLVPASQRGQALGFARAGLVTTQGIGVVAGGLLAQWTGAASTAIVWAGAAGTCVALAAAAAWSRARPGEVAAALPAEG